MTDLDDSDGPHEITDWDDLDVDSDDDTELLTHGIEPEIIPESVDDICDSKDVFAAVFSFTTFSSLNRRELVL